MARPLDAATAAYSSAPPAEDVLHEHVLGAYGAGDVGGGLTVIHSAAAS
jgi:hypothetical protein